MHVNVSWKQKLMPSESWRVLWSHEYSTYSGFKFHRSSPLVTQGPVSSASPSSTHSHRGWGRTAGPCTSTYSRIQSWPSPPCRNPPHVHCHCAAASRHPCLEGAWCTYSGSLSPLTSSEQAPSPRRSGRQNANFPNFSSTEKRYFESFFVLSL